jgi:hypothetical protein
MKGVETIEFYGIRRTLFFNYYIFDIKITILIIFFHENSIQIFIFIF